jgi:hypothetical protein
MRSLIVKRRLVVGDVGLFMSIPNLSTNSDDLGADPYIDAISQSLSWGGDAPSTRALDPSTS